MSEVTRRIVAAGYDTAAGRYASLEESDVQWPRTRWLCELLAQLPDGAAVLDVGCATGIPSAVEISKRHQVTGVDVSAEQIEQARKNVPSGKFVCADAVQTDFPAGGFDAVVSFYSFDHIPRERHSLLLGRIHRWLRPGGYLLLSVEDADQPGTVAEWLGVEMYFSMFDADTTRVLVQRAGFTIAKTAVEEQVEEGVSIPYVWILAKKGKALQIS